jgi:Ras-related protein Rab-2A
MIGTGDENYE